MIVFVYDLVLRACLLGDFFGGGVAGGKEVGIGGVGQAGV
jgi:hypothetical protein